MSVPAPVLDLPRALSPACPALVSVRTPRWTKNLLLFAGIIFAARLDDPSRWGETLAAFVAYCAASSASYLINDGRDAPRERVHPVKLARPIAPVELSRRLAEALGVALVLIA